MLKPVVNCVSTLKAYKLQYQKHTGLKVSCTYCSFECYYSPNYVTPLTAVHSANKYDNDEVIYYTGSPRHCIVAADRVAVNETKWQDDFQ